MAIWFNEHQTPGHSLNWRVNRVLHWEKSPYQEIQVVKGEDRYDVILTDSSGPVGEAAKLFSEEYYKLINLALNPDGMFVARTQSPFYDGALISEVNKVMKSLFPLVRVYLGCTPTYPGGLWTFSLGSKKFDPLDAELKDWNLETRYYSAELHRGAFQLPRMVRNLLDSKGGN